ncbi:Canalicular multispecific organic anion transporter 2 [Linnemannia exigua]|uniref:Canalicular multispecific organic anion transporter 2 n=1 Tax=Linnemannia exigua TaxID=604196 RepID=A0AAD4DEH6_9FUNG|nr:Canalicular multispecific organic anion transporter 2 [Linnemannia exigua]
MAAAWCAAYFVNRLEHKFEIRSSTVIFAFYLATITSTGVILHTHYDLYGINSTATQLLHLILAFVVQLIGFTLEAWPRGSTRVQQLSGAPEYDKANIFSRLIMYFFQPVVRIGIRRTLTAEDTANLLSEGSRTQPGYKRLSARWNANLKKRSRNLRDYQRPPSLFWTVIRTQLVALLPIVVCRIVIVLLSFALPVLLSQLLDYLQNYEDFPLSYGISLACAMFLVAFIVALLYTYNRYQMFLINVETKAALISMIYRKSLRLSPGSRKKSTTGEITNHMAVDAEQWNDGMVFLSTWVSIPLEIGIALFLLYRFMGWTMIAGFLGMVLLLPLQALQARVFEMMQARKLEAMDQRIRLTTEVLAGIKIVKIYGWESAFLQRILSVRNQELVALKMIGVLQAFMSIIFISSSLIISLITFGVFALWGGPNFTPGTLTPQVVFVSLTLFSMLRHPIAGLSQAITSTIGLVVGTRRIQEFLLREEIREEDVIRFNKVPKDPQDPVIFIKDASFTWSDSTPSTSLTDISVEHEECQPLMDDPSFVEIHATLESINLSVRNGSLVAIVGRVGQGKSSLLSAIIGEMYKLQGRIQVSGRIAYVPQQSWIMNATLRDNILFGNEYNQDRYQHILYACGLEPDLAILPAGDMTEIGERGINLSGGQKQRVSLARAAYDNADIYLLDDPLSAVDAHVDRHLWDHLLGPTGLLRNKARVLVTHGIQHLREVDQIVMLKDGSIVEQGEYQELMRDKKMFYQLIKEYATARRPSLSGRKKSSTTAIPPKDPSAADEYSFNNVTSDIDHSNTTVGGATLLVPETQESDSVSFTLSEATERGNQEDADETFTTSPEPDNVPATVAKDSAKKDTKAELIAAEKMKEGQVDTNIFFVYMKALRYRNAILMGVLFILAQVCLIGTSLWLKYWIKRTQESQDLASTTNPRNPRNSSNTNDINDTDTNNNNSNVNIAFTEQPSVGLFLGVYALLTFFYVLLYVVVSWLTFAKARIRASALLHRNLLTKIMRLPMSFFDTTPLGRVLNRFSSDFTSIDDRLPNKFFDASYFLVTVAGTFTLIIYTAPQFLLALPFLTIAYYGIQVCFLRISQVVTRMYSVSKSPVYQHFSESLNGVSTIRAMAVQERFIDENERRMDRMANNFMGSMIAKRWVEVQLRLLSTFVLLFAALFAVLGREHLDPSLVGLTVSYAMSITEEITSLVRIGCDFQNKLVAVERVIEYTNLETEAPEHTNVALPPDWPNQGHIRFKNYSTRYREGLEILPAQKIGIVGRTGAGKSSLTLALFRIIEAASADSTPMASAESGVAIDVNGEAREEDDGNDGEDNDGGSIEIDGIDISTIGLQDLRKHLAIIPQDPTLFAGTVRENLDPFQELDDLQLWQALDRSHLKETISSLPGGLHFEVSQNGDNFSVGQRSLICLARALLRKSKILVMDEATAAVDVETDELIQQTIRKEFADRTVLTIAHRIKTVMDSDKILVLEKGRVEEFEAPQVLLRRKGTSLFYKLAEQAGEI